LGDLGELGENQFMGHAQESHGRTAQNRPSRKRKARNELEELRQENQQLRKTVAHLSKLVLTQIAGAAELKERSATAED
jgi:transposase-like protein